MNDFLWRVPNQDNLNASTPQPRGVVFKFKIKESGDADTMRRSAQREPADPAPRRNRTNYDVRRRSRPNTTSGRPPERT